jgi:IS605 OrfB family transposase
MIENNSEKKKERHNKDDCFSQTFKTLQKNVSQKDAEILDAMIFLFNKEKRHWLNFQDKTSNGRKKFIQNQRQYYDNIGYSYRFFQGIRQEILGMEKSILSNTKNYLIEKKSKLKTQLTKIKNASISYKTRKKNDDLDPNELFFLRQKYKKKYCLENDIKDLEKNELSICFGGKKLLNERNSLTNQDSIQDWIKRWYNARNNQMLFVGSHDETQGNLNCQLSYNENSESFSLKIRIPDCLENKFKEKYLILNNINIPFYAYGKVKMEVLKQQTKDIDKQALAFRLIKNDKGYALNITINSQKETIITSNYEGLIGVDINPDNLAVTEIDSKGNLLHSFVLPMDLKSKSQGQRQSIINDAIIELKNYALLKKKDIVIEKLDFKKKRADLHKNKSPKYAQMLSSFAYQQIINGIKVNGYKFGINVKEVDPSYTSIIGKNKYAIPLGLSVHQAAAYVIARRGYAYKEKIKQLFQTNKKSEVFTLLVPEGKQNLNNLKVSRSFVAWLNGKFGKSFYITESTSGAERYVPHNKLSNVGNLKCDSDRILVS